MPVIAARKLHDARPVGECPCHADRAHRRLSAGADEPHSLHRRHQRPHQFAELVLEGGGCSEARAVLGRRADGANQPARRMAVNQRAPRHHVVDVGVAVDIANRCPGGAADEQRRPADCLKGTDGAVDAAGENGARSREELLGCSWLFHR